MFLEPSRHSESLGRTFIVLGAEMALSAVLHHKIDQAGGKENAGSPRTEPPIVLDAIFPIIGVSFKVHVSLLNFS